MPKSWYLAALIALAVWTFAIYWSAQVLPWDPALVGFAGTVLTLLPTAVESLRRFYLATHRASPPPDAGQKQVARDFAGFLSEAMQGFDWIYALSFALGLSGIAFAFARQYLSG